jgi:maltose alpha-D-glucosyltransferase/alpha-amylase
MGRARRGLAYAAASFMNPSAAREGLHPVSSSPLTRTNDLWWKNAVIYCLDVEKFMDANGDGIGDFEGLIEKVDYLAGLGVTCIWLMPFYASPNGDDGYDIADYYSVDPRLGSLGDFTDFMQAAGNRGLKVMADLVVNHTSVTHPWFQAARRRHSPFQDFYVWSDEKPKEAPKDIIFPDRESSIWAWDDEAERWYLHRFYSFEPDLNVANPLVRDEIRKITAFWLRLGLAGFRVDAVPYLIEIGVPGSAHGDALQWFDHLASYVSRRDAAGALLGEVNVAPEDLRRYFADAPGDGLEMLFGFIVNQALYLALARERSEPLYRALRSLPDIPGHCQWVNFVRNHDELTLDKLSAEERDEVFRCFAPDNTMRLYGRGIRRRVPTMLNGRRARIELAYSLMFALPGTPALLWGEELGLAENLALDGRLAVRTPMQWSDERNAGFSSAAPDRLVAPVRAEGPYGYSAVNAARQRHDPNSLLNWMERLIRMRKECPEIGWGRVGLLTTGETAVFAHRFDWEGRVLLFGHNLSQQEATIHLRDGIHDLGMLIDLFTGERIESVGGVEIHLDGFGYRWFRGISSRQ